MSIFVSPFISVTPNRVRTKLKLGINAYYVDSKRYTSDIFAFPARKNAFWKLGVILSDYIFESVELILVYTEAPISNAISGTIYILNETRSFGPKVFGCPGEKLSIEARIGRRQVPEHELDIEIPSLQNSKTAEVKTPEVKTCVLSDDLSKMFLAKTLSDVILEVEEEDIPAHKVILSARSSVFMAMFQSGMQEEHNSRVKITDVPVEVVKELLRYAYTGVVEKMDSLAPELMIAADKYNIIELEDRCRQWLLANLSAETAARLLLLADSLSDEILMKAMIRFTVENLPKVIESSGWSSLTSQRPMLMEDLLKAISHMKVTM